jgi:hypothetical protein
LLSPQVVDYLTDNHPLTEKEDVMKRTLLIVISLILALVLINSTAMAYNSAVFLDDDDATFLPNAGAWTESNFNPTTYGQGYHFARRNGSILTAGPYLRMLTPSSLDVSGGGVTGTSGSLYQANLRWSGGNRCSNVRVEVWNFTDNALVTSTTIDQTIRTQSFNWNPVGLFYAQPGDRYEIRVYANNNIVSGGGINCVVTVDGGAFIQQTYDSSDVFNLTNSSIVDEAGIDYDTNTGSVTIASTSASSPTLLQGPITITCPRSGYIHAQGSGGYSYVRAGSTSATAVPYIWYGVSTTTSLDTSNATIHGEKQGASSTVNAVLGYSPITTDRVDSCSAGQSLTYRFVAIRGGGAGDLSGVANPRLVATYYPTRY